MQSAPAPPATSWSGSFSFSSLSCSAYFAPRYTAMVRREWPGVVQHLLALHWRDSWHVSLWSLVTYCIGYDISLWLCNLASLAHSLFTDKWCVTQNSRRKECCSMRHCHSCLEVCCDKKWKTDIKKEIVHLYGCTLNTMSSLSMLCELTVCELTVSVTWCPCFFFLSFFLPLELRHKTFRMSTWFHAEAH